MHVDLDNCALCGNPVGEAHRKVNFYDRLYRVRRRVVVCHRCLAGLYSGDIPIFALPMVLRVGRWWGALARMVRRWV